MTLLPTTKMAKELGLSPDFLRKNKEVLFFKGVHYTRPQGLNKDLWIVEKMMAWATGEEQISQKAKEVLENIL